MLTIDQNSGWLSAAQHIPSDNFNQRPDQEVSLLVIHNISLPPGEFGTSMVDALFTNNLPIDAHPFFAEISELRVSAHFLVERSGHIKQYVSCNDRAWHAGISSFAGRDNCNDFSIGIELEGTDYQPFTDAQYSSLQQLTTEIMRCYPQISTGRICGHSDIAPGRKTDPGPFFDWKRYLEGCAQGLYKPADKSGDNP